MAQTFTGRKRVRKVFGTSGKSAKCRTSSRCRRPPTTSSSSWTRPRAAVPTRACSRCSSRCSRSPISRRPRMLEFVKYEFEAPKYDVDECRQRGMTFAAPLKVTLRLIVFDVDPETQAQVRQGHQGAGRLHGRHAAHDGERHLHRQRHRARHRLADAPLARACSSTTTRARAIRPASCCSPRASFPIAARGSTSSSTPRTSSRPHRPSPQDPGDVAAVRARPRRRGDPVDLLQAVDLHAGTRTAGACLTTPSG